MAMPEHQHEESPFADVEHPKRRLFLEALCELGTKAAAARAVGISLWTPYSDGWKADTAFQRGLQVAEEVAADRAEHEAWRRAVEGVRRYRHSSKTGAPLLNPDVCDRCDRPRREHVRTPDGVFGPNPKVDCPGFEPTPYYEREFSDATLMRILQAYRPERFSERLHVSSLVANLDMSSLPDVALARIANGEDPQAVLATVIAQGGRDAEQVLQALPPSAVGRPSRDGRTRSGEIVQEDEDPPGPDQGFDGLGEEL